MRRRIYAGLFGLCAAGSVQHAMAQGASGTQNPYGIQWTPAQSAPPPTVARPMMMNPLGFYVSASAGVSINEPDRGRSGITGYSQAQQTYVTDPASARDSFGIGPDFHVAAGIQPLPGVRLEAELGYVHAGLSSISWLDNGTNFQQFAGQKLNAVNGGAVNKYSFSINAFYDILVHAPIRPYFGFGFGFVKQDIQSASFGSGNTAFSLHGGSENYAMFLFELGAMIPVGEHLFIGPAYRYEHNISTFNRVIADVNVLKLGMRYVF